MKIKSIIIAGMIVTLSAGWFFWQRNLSPQNDHQSQQIQEDVVPCKEGVERTTVSDAIAEHEKENEDAAGISENVEVKPAEKIPAEHSMEQAVDREENVTVQDHNASTEEPQPDMSAKENVAETTVDQGERITDENLERVEEPASHLTETPQNPQTPNTPEIPLIPFVPVGPYFPQITEKPAKPQKPNEETVETPDRTDAEIKEVIDNFVDNFKNTKDFSEFTGTALEYIDENLDIIKNKPESNKIVSTFIKNFKSGFTSKEELEFFLSEWLGGGGAYSKAITYSY